MARQYRGIFVALICGLVAACAPLSGHITTAQNGPLSNQGQADDAPMAIDQIARQYVRLTLEAGTHEPGYVDAYYGPAAWKTEAEAGPRSVAMLLIAADTLISGLNGLIADDAAIAQGAPPVDVQRARALKAQLLAAQTRLRMMQGETLSFREESLGLFGATPELKPLAHYDNVLNEIEAIVPGKGPLAARVDAFQNRYIIPKERLKPVFDRAIAECKARTTRFISLPRGERFSMEFVTDKPWSGYNYYQGDYNSLIQINTDLPIRISRAVDLGCHEGYPGHHALNMLLEQRLTRAENWAEYSVYPLYSPLSLIAEGSANYGIALAFPGDQKLQFERDVLYPLAGLDPSTAPDLAALNTALAALSGARFTIAAHYLDGQIDRAEAIRLTQVYQLVSKERARQSIDFTETYRSYVINYGLGQDMVRDYVTAQGPDPIDRWAAMERVISSPFLPVDLIVK